MLDRSHYTVRIEVPSSATAAHVSASASASASTSASALEPSTLSSDSGSSSSGVGGGSFLISASGGYGDGGGGDDDGGGGCGGIGGSNEADNASEYDGGTARDTPHSSAPARMYRAVAVPEDPVVLFHVRCALEELAALIRSQLTVTEAALDGDLLTPLRIIR